jgi:hypothetical protein
LPPNTKQLFQGSSLTDISTQQLRGGLGKAGTERFASLARADFSLELRKLNRELLRAYIELIDALSKPCGTATKALQDVPVRITEILDNMAHLLSMLREHQARQTLIAAMRSQVARRNQRAEEIGR